MKTSTPHSIDCEYDMYDSPGPGINGIPKIHPRPVGRQKHTMESILRGITRGDTTRTIEYERVIGNFLDEVAERLCKGDSVHIKGLGTLKVKLKGPKDVTSASKVRAEHIQLEGISLNPDRKLVNEMKRNIHFVRSQDATHSAKLDLMPLIDIMCDIFSTKHYDAISSKDLMDFYHIKRQKAQFLIDMAVKEGYLKNISHQRTNPLYCPTPELTDYINS